MDFSKLNFAVDGDSITQGDQWSAWVHKLLGFATHTNVAVGSSVWYKRTECVNGTYVTTQDFDDPDFAGISGGWEPTDDVNEMQMRMNNCAVVHIQRFIAGVKKGEFPVPDVFAFAMGTNDAPEKAGCAERALEGKSLDGVDLFCEAGAIRWCIQTIAENFPECRIFLLTPIQAADPGMNRKNRVVCENIKKIARGLSVQVIDTFGGCGITEKFETEGGEGRYLRDGLHPKENGQEREGRFAAAMIKSKMY